MLNFEPRPAARQRVLLAKFIFAASLAAAVMGPSAAAAVMPRTLDVMPAPAELKFSEGQFALTEKFAVAVRGHDDARLQDGITRAMLRWKERTGLTFAPGTVRDATPAGLVIECQGPGQTIPAVDEDESYTLDVTAAQVNLRAPTVVGALRGLETLLQLLNTDGAIWFVPAVSVRDQPRFPWRGLLIDVCRHWQPIEVIKRNLDGMALVKLNVLHLHLTEDQGFRVESKTFPKLHELGSDGHYFTQDQIREIIAYATARGIRVMPEFDIPGHATSWVVGYPELASAPGPYSIERQWGVFDPVLDPTNEKTYELLDGFLGEMAALFPDAYLHIGGDENNGQQWSANAHIQAFIREHNLKNNEGLHAYFNRRVGEILAKHGKKLIGWDEILHPDLPKESAVHSWRGAEGLTAAAKQGHAVVLSNGYYIDLIYPASDHYANDPLPANSPLTAQEKKLVLGGEATMWSEWTSPETIDSRIWPRTAAIAERLWSPREVNDVRDMYRRLAHVSRRLEEAGLQHEKNIDPMLRRLAGDAATPTDLAALRTFVDVIEPVKHYRRGREQKGVTQFTALSEIPDCARPDSAAARAFAFQVDDVLFSDGKTDPAQIDSLGQQLDLWHSVGHDIAHSLVNLSPHLHDAAPLAQSLADVSAIGLDCLEVLAKGGADAAWIQTQLALLTQAEKPGAACELPIIAPLKLLVVGVAEQAKRRSLPADAWRQHVREIAFPPKAPAKNP